MKTVDIFESIGTHLFNDSRVQRYGMILLESGTKGLTTVDPVMVWIDAGIAVCEACGSYLRYAAQKEINKRLEIENQTLRRELASQLKLLGLHYDKLVAEQDQRAAQIELALMTMIEQRESILMRIRKDSQRVHEIHRMVLDLRQQGYSKELESLQTTLDILVNASLQCLAQAAS